MLKSVKENIEKTLREIAKKHGATIKHCYWKEEDFSFYACFPCGIIVSVVYNKYSTGFERELFEIAFCYDYDDWQTSGGMTIENIVEKIELRMFGFSQV